MSSNGEFLYLHSMTVMNFTKHDLINAVSLLRFKGRSLALLCRSLAFYVLEFILGLMGSTRVLRRVI